MKLSAKGHIFIKFLQIRFCTTVIATSSAQHSAVSLGQWDYYRFIPNSPPSMVLPIHKRGEVCYKIQVIVYLKVNSSTTGISFSADAVFAGKISGIDTNWYSVSTIFYFTRRGGIYGIVFFLSVKDFCNFQVFLGDFPLSLFSGHGMQEVITKFQEDLSEHKRRVEKRNALINYPYEYLKPGEIPASTAI